jgi:2,4-dienoyl-CoA reductase-like NADH-dependent reductase (Old Yellow Enzyme family)
MAHLFSPLTLRDLTLRNRIGVSPMCQYSSVDGFASDWHLVHLGGLATGGAGLVIAEATAVLPEGRISPHDLGLWHDDHMPMLRRITQFVKAQGAAVGVQLAHAGRKASTARPWEGGGTVRPEQGGWTTVMAPSAIRYSERYPEPQALDAAGIAAVIAGFRDAAARAITSGFDVIELHAAHGYLLHSFLSPLTNHRDDAYGGSFANRSRLLLDVVDAVRSVWPATHPLFVRVSATDWAEGGWEVQDTVVLARALAERGVDVLDCSSGGLVAHQRIPLGPGYQVPLAARVKHEAGVRTAAVGLITEAAQAAAIVAEEQADLVLMARALLRNPRWPLEAARSLGADAAWPPQYERGR